MQVADDAIGDHHVLPQRVERLLAPAALEVVPERGQPLQLVLRVGQVLPLQVRIGRRRLQPLIDIGEPRALGRLAVGLVLRRLALLLLAREIRGERGELLMAGLPQAAQLEEHQRAESGARIGEQIAERIQLLLHADGRAFLLLQAVAQQVKFVLEIGVGFFEARAILEQLHEPLFVGAHAAPFTSFEKTQLIDQCPAST